MARLHLLRILAAAWLVAAAGPACAADLYVISNRALALTPEEVKEIFLGETEFSGNLKLQPVDNTGAQAEFLSHVLKMTSVKYSASWTKKAFREGRNAPPLKGSDAEVMYFVKNNPGAIGYVTTEPHDVYIVGKF